MRILTGVAAGALFLTAGAAMAVSLGSETEGSESLSISETVFQSEVFEPILFPELGPPEALVELRELLPPVVERFRELLEGPYEVSGISVPELGEGPETVDEVVNEIEVPVVELPVAIEEPTEVKDGIEEIEGVPSLIVTELDDDEVTEIETPTSVPLPAGIWLLGSVLGILAFGRFRKSNVS